MVRPRGGKRILAEGNKENERAGRNLVDSGAKRPKQQKQRKRLLYTSDCIGNIIQRDLYI